jgi:hypothetical protein
MATDQGIFNQGVIPHILCILSILDGANYVSWGHQHLWKEFPWFPHPSHFRMGGLGVNIHGFPLFDPSKEVMGSEVRRSSNGDRVIPPPIFATITSR